MGENIAPKRIRLSRAKGWRMPPNTINVARPGKWGNPFIVGTHGTRLQVVGKFYQLTGGFIDLGGPDVELQLALFKRVRRSIHELAGFDLACWCAIDGEPCHADVLLHLANGCGVPSMAGREIDFGKPRIGVDAVCLMKNRRRRDKRVQS